MVKEVRIISSLFTDSSSKKIICDRVTYSLKKNVEKTPNANSGSLVEVQTRAFENPVITVSGVRLTGESGTLTLRNIQELIKGVYDGTNAPTLSVTFANYDFSGEQSLTSLDDLTTTNIPVILSNHTLNIDATGIKDGHLPIGTLTFTETV
jgi:hypothetical protein